MCGELTFVPLDLVIHLPFIESAQRETTRYSFGQEFNEEERAEVRSRLAALRATLTQTLP
jgi:hypothetical protein